MIFLEYVGSRASLSAKLMKVVKRSDFFRSFYFIGFEPIVWMRDQSENLEIVFQKVCKSQFYYFCIGNFKNELLWNLHMNKFRK